jgi:hypothetical protein
VVLREQLAAAQAAASEAGGAEARAAAADARAAQLMADVTRLTSELAEAREVRAHGTSPINVAGNAISRVC